MTRLLIVTQAVDVEDPILGFFVRWIEEFAKHTDRVTVICLRKGTFSFPENVAVYSLGKEEGRKPSFIYSLRFLWLSLRLRNQYDSVFVHMNPEYLIISGWFWRLFRKPAVLWYLHGAVSWRLRIGAFFAKKILTASPESMRLRSHKKVIVGHGIDINFFSPVPPPRDPSPHLVTISRIAPVKRIDLLIEAFSKVVEQVPNATLSIVGPVAEFDREYARGLEEIVEKKGVTKNIVFVGALDRKGVRDILSYSHLFLHASATGSIDKAPLEALAMGIPVLTQNRELGQLRSAAIAYVNPQEQDLGSQILACVERREWEQVEVRKEARELIETQYALESLIGRILHELHTR